MQLWTTEWNVALLNTCVCVQAVSNMMVIRRLKLMSDEVRRMVMANRAVLAREAEESIHSEPVGADNVRPTAGPHTNHKPPDIVESLPH